MNAPVILFVYKRLDKAMACLNALNKNIGCEETNLIIFSDGAKNIEDIEQVDEVRKFIKEFQQSTGKFRKIEIYESEKNKGLANSIIDGVTAIIKEYGKVIVVEDDLITAKSFLKYMNDALNFYEKNMKIGSISGYTVPIKSLQHYGKDIYITRKGECWGWGTWKNRWLEVDWSVGTFEEYINNSKMRNEFGHIGYGLDTMLCEYMNGTLDVWAVRWCYHLFRMGQWTVYPRRSQTMNVGVDGSGEHCSPTDKYSVDIEYNDIEYVFENLKINKKKEREFYNFESGESVINKFWRLWHKIKKNFTQK